MHKIITRKEKKASFVAGIKFTVACPMSTSLEPLKNQVTIEIPSSLSPPDFATRRIQFIVTKDNLLALADKFDLDT